MRKRKNYSKSEILNHLQTQQISGQSSIGYCDEQGLNRSTFFRWRSQHRAPKQVGIGKFIELPRASASRNSIVDIELSSGARVRFYREADKELIGLVIRNL